MSRALWAFILCAARLLSVNAAAADEPAVPVEAMIPVVAVHLDRPVTAEEMDDVVSGLAAPVLRGNALRSRLGLPPSPDNSRVDEVIRAFEKGEDLFFTGNHEEAARAFETVVARLADNPSMLAFKPALRKVAFKAHIHLAIISRGNGDGASEEAHLRAAEEFPELSLSPADFPPWVCERFTSLKESSSPTGEGAITLAVPRACELILGGRSLGQGLLFPNIVPGVKIVQVRCGDHLSPVQEVVVAKGGIRYHPLIFTASRLGESNEVTLVANGRADQEGIVSDILLLGGKTGHHRLVAVVGTNDGLAVWLVDDRLKRVIRENRALTGDSEGAKRAAEALVPASQERGFADAPLAKQPWYRNAAAWTLVGSGAALLGTGIVLYAQHGSPSQLMPVTLALLASGAGIAGTGVVLFFFPALRSRDASASSAGITAGLSMGRSF